jgi:FkbM family methyltransferase
MNTNGEFRFLKSLFQNRYPERVFDVGANLGYYTEKLLEINDNVEIHCFEPTKAVCKKLKQKFQSEKVYVNNIALSDRNGSRLFYENKTNHSFNSFYPVRVGRNHNIKTERVLTTTLDDYCELKKIQHVDLLKIDTEGHELQVLKGAKGMLSKQAIDIIQFEFGYASIFARTFLKDFFDLFSKFDYEIYKIKPLRIEKITYRAEIERCSYANFLAVRKGIKKL